MARKEIKVRVCDRCPRATPATESVEVCYQQVTYKLDLCCKHKEMMESDIEGWTRLGREAETQHGAKKWIPGETFRTRADKPALVGGKDYTYVDGIRQSRPQALVIPPARGEDIIIETPVEPSHVDDLDVEEVELRPTNSLHANMAAAEVNWEQVVEAVDSAFAITPSRTENVSCYLTAELSVLVADDGAVVGVARRDPADPLPQTSETHKRRIVRKGKRGGQGRVSMTMKEVVDAINAEPGWWVDDSRPHYAVHGPNGERYTMPKTGSDHRGVTNTLLGLRAVGLDLLTRARQAS